MIFRAMFADTKDRDPFEFDELRYEMFNMEVPDSVDDAIMNSQVLSMIEANDLHYLVPLMNRVVWLHHVKESCGVLPDDFLPLSYIEYIGLVTIWEESQRQSAKEAYDVRQNTQNARSSAPPASAMTARSGFKTTRSTYRGFPSPR